MLVPLALVSNCDMTLPEPLDAPLALVAAAVQVYVVPETAFGFVIAIDVDSPEQMV